ncbi:Vasorin Protein slit-like 2 [Triplophysa tibetana]|uniref:Vasorin Protein slit-like 2 n=1 Tax=Triplophysa tibetana TaxID=1572043 RepID=A0A5A9NTM6_9TELE|nr:Vasorin Protein slit-like 2 [Triplophysa tibetana]
MPDRTMRVQCFLSHLILLQLLCGSLSSGCPQICTCNPNDYILCVQRNLIYMPHGLPSSTKELFLFQNNINTLKKQDFIELGQLVMLDLSQNILSEFPDGVFKSLSSLNNLDLSSNRITHISKDSFKGLLNLERLYLYNNQIRSIHPAAFEGLENLLELKLQGNEISVLPALRLPRLLHLDLSFNSIPPPRLDDLQTPHLESLKIAGLGLGSLDEGLLKSLVNLHVLDVSQNQLHEIQPTLKAMAGLRNLNLSGNPLGSLKREDFKNLVYLSELDLSSLNLHGFPERFFNLFPRLEQLTIAENPFNCICPLAWLPAWLKDAKVQLLRTKDTRCHFPPINSGKDLAMLEHKDFGCPTTTIELTSAGTRSTTNKPTDPTTPSGTTHAILPPPPSKMPFIDSDTLRPSHTTASPSRIIEEPEEEEQEELMCPPSICLNGGTCKFDSFGQFVCLCPPHTLGHYCEVQNEARPPPPSPRISIETIATVQPKTISSHHVTSTSITLDLHRYIETRPQIRGVRLTYRNLSGPDQRPLHLNVPASYPEYTLRGLQSNSTYSVCASPLGEPIHSSIDACVEVRTANTPPPSHEPSVDKTEPSSSLIPIVVAVAVVMVAAIIAAVVVIRRRKRSKAPIEMGLHETSPLELEGVKANPENGVTHPKQLDITPCPSLTLNSLEYNALLKQGQCPANNNLGSNKPSYL